MIFRKDKIQIFSGQSSRPSLGRLLFAPEFGRSVRPLRQNFGMFVGLVAGLLAQAGLLSREMDGPVGAGLRGEGRLRLMEVLGAAYKNVRWTKEGLPQAVFFMAVAGMLLFGVLSILTIILLVISGPAAAEDVPAPPAPAFSIFGAATPQDMAPRWLDYLFFGVPLPEFGLELALYQDAFQKLLGFYSHGMLFFAAIILFYFLVRMAIESAHEGQPFGSKVNVLWASIRLVLAVLLLVPITLNMRENTTIEDAEERQQITLHMNLGQYIVYHVALLGSNFASHAWQALITNARFQPTLPAARGCREINPAPGQRLVSCDNDLNIRIHPDVRAIGENATYIGFCQRLADVLSRVPGAVWSHGISIQSAGVLDTLSERDRETATSLAALSANGGNGVFHAEVRDGEIHISEQICYDSGPMAGECDLIVHRAQPAAEVLAQEAARQNVIALQSNGAGGIDYSALRQFLIPERMVMFGINAPRDNFNTTINYGADFCGRISLLANKRLNPHLGARTLETFREHSTIELTSGHGPVRNSLQHAQEIELWIRLSQLHQEWLDEFFDDYARYGQYLADQMLQDGLFTSTYPRVTAGTIRDQQTFEQWLRLYMQYANHETMAAVGDWFFQVTDNGTDGIERLGWMGAGIFFNTMARLQGTPYRILSEFPKVEANTSTPRNPARGNFQDYLASGYSELQSLFMQGQANFSAAGARLRTGTTVQAESIGADEVVAQISPQSPPIDQASQIMSLIGIENGLYDDANNDGVADASWIAKQSGIRSFDASSAIFSLTDLGHRLMNTSLGNFSGAATALGLATVAGLVTLVPHRAAALIGGLVKGISDLVAQFLLIFAFAGFLAAIILAHVLPLIFFFRFTIGILTWLATIFEAMIAVPVFALGNLNPEGDGLGTQALKRTYMYLLQLLLRPILMIFGLVIALLIINSMIGFLNLTFAVVAGSSHPVEAHGVLKDLVWLIIYAIVAYSIVNVAVKMVDILPEQGISWIGEEGLDYKFDDREILSRGTKLAGAVMTTDALGKTQAAFKKTSDEMAAIGQYGGQKISERINTPPSGSAP